MTYTVLTLSLIAIVLFYWLYNLMSNCFSRAFCIVRNRKSGSVTKEASIIAVNTIRGGKKPLLELLLLFENFSGHHIHRKIRVWDTKPHLRRFEMDKTIEIGLNIARKPKNPIFLSQKPCRFSFVMVIICSLKIIVYVIGSYILMGEALERIFSAPNTYEQVFATSYTWQIGLTLIGVSVLLYLLLQKIGVLVDKKSLEHNWNLLFYGIGTTATVSDRKNTGTLVRAEPVFDFSYLFRSQNGEKIKGTDKKIAENNQSAQEIDQVEVMYLPGSPYVSRITENLENQDFSRFLHTIFMVAVFIFSLVFLISFYQTVFHSTING
ncbi:hypothetical protein [Flagellimonas marinaquae]|uniref:hypothetical protein n=1 Tax=Flagellimonas marinaquae TaxID=254955 RepID=UPI000F8C791C|nr:hypothetical protein [Allomuricauda aquimarina]